VLHSLVCFDAGFTLIRPRHTMAERLAEVLEAHGHAAEPEDIHRAWEGADAWFWDSYHQPGNLTWTADDRIEETWRSYHRVMLEHLGFTDAGHELIEAILAGQFSADSWEPYPETVEALEAVRSAGSRVAVISDWGSMLADVLSGVGLDPYLDLLVVSAVEGVAKPAPELFRLAHERMGVAAHEAVMIGDSYRADVLGARAAGMDAILLDRDGTAPETDVPVARSLTEALELAAGLAAKRERHPSRR
jgi:putative hydrolase of the HAD superfamily